MTDLTSFARWIPDLAAATGVSSSLPKKTKFDLATPANAQAALVNDVADCGCDVLPWDDCVHTKAM